MKKTAYAAVLLLLLAGAFLAGSWRSRGRTAAPPAPAARKILYYVDPMHPAYKSDKPGIAPDCGMQLEPVYADGGTAAADAAGHASSPPPGSMAIDPAKQQLIGVQVSAVEKSSGSRTLRLFGRVVPDEARVYRVNAGADGSVREVSAVTTGSQVKKDQWLASCFMPDARVPLQAYLTALDVVDRAAQVGTDNPLQLRSSNGALEFNIERLRNVGMSSFQLDEIKKTREIPLAIRILAPASGFVLARNVSPGLKFEKGAEWFRIADLSRVWILADVFENEAQYLRPGVRALASLPEQRKSLTARVAEVLPQFDAATRTLKVRLEADNPGNALRPEMFVDVELPIAFPATITVPVESVLDSGLRKTVFVERGEGVFEPRQVETGWRFGDRVEIVKGLAPGDRIVVSGTFFLDSESRMKAAAANSRAGQLP